MILAIGEILIDRFPDYERIGGAPFNFAFHLRQMGFPVRFVTRIGKDSYGRQILTMLQTHGFDCSDVQIDPGHATGRVDVRLDASGVPQFDICRDAAYDYLDLSMLTIDRSSTQMIYFGSLVQRTKRGYDQVQGLLERRSPSTSLFCDINLRPPHINNEAVSRSIRHADILKLNEDELHDISHMCNGPLKVSDAIAWLMQSNDIFQIALTLGSKGSTVFTAAQESVSRPPPKGISVIDTVGAGDAYASVLAAGYLKQLPISLTLELATDFAAHVCNQPGAIPDDDYVYHLLRRKINA